MEKFNLKNFYYLGQWEQPPLSAWFWVHWYDKLTLKKMGVGSLSGKIIMINGHTLVDKKDLQTLKNLLIDICQNNDLKFFKRFSQASKEVIKEHFDLTKKLKKSNQISPEFFEEFISSSRKVVVPWYINVIFSDYIGDILLEKAEKFNFKSSEIIKCIPQKKTLMTKEYEETLRIKNILKKEGLLRALKISKSKGIDKIKSNNKVWSKIESHLEKYGWVGTHHFWGEPLSFNKFCENILEFEEKNITEKCRSLPKELSFSAKFAGEIGFLRQYAAEVFDLVVFETRPFLSGVAKKLGLSYEELLFLTPNEISKYLKKKLNPSKRNILKRKKGFCIFMDDKKEIIIDNLQTVKDLIKKISINKDASSKDLKGAVAYQGYVKGRVKVFLVPEQLSKMKQGDILVTTMTTPDFVPLMRKSSAIVTDIGGLLSHAAIISRELKKPCIIGTEIATKVLKDGDLVEVDANQGIVRKLKS